jgi:diguanylate cyclase (GGDEF)-like protein
MSMATSLAPLLEEIVGRVDIGLCIVNLRREITFWNRFMELSSGRSSEQVVGRGLFEAFPDLGRWIERKIESAVVLGHPLFSAWEQRPYVFRFASRRKVVGGLDHMAQNCTFMPMKDAENNVTAVCLVIHDATDTCIYQKRLEAVLAQVKEMAIRDELTGLYNRRHIEGLFRAEFVRCQRYRSPFSALMVDLDFFKQVNDQHGHLGGDAVLRAISERLSRAIRATDAIGRYGGEELLVLFPEVGLEQAREGAERLRAIVEQAPVAFGERSISVTISIGLAAFREGYLRPEEMLRAADEALYESKYDGRNRVTCAPA